MQAAQTRYMTVELTDRCWKSFEMQIAAIFINTPPPRKEFEVDSIKLVLMKAVWLYRYETEFSVQGSSLINILSLCTAVTTYQFFTYLF